MSVAIKNKTTDARIPRREVFAYGLGDVSASLVWNSVSAFALIFYTDVALLPAAAIGTLFFFSRIFDAFFDVGIGIAVDRTRTRFGRARPYLIAGAVPFGVLGIFTFWVPEANDTVRFWYAAFTYFTIGLLLSVVTIPYSAMLPMMSTNKRDRIDLSAARSVATSIGVIVVTALFMPGVAYFGDGDQAHGFLIMAVITSVVATLMLLTCAWQCKERVPATQTSDLQLGKDILFMFKNTAWIVASGFAFLNFIRFGALLALTPYFAINVLKQPWMISVLLPTLSGTLLIGAFIARPLLNRFGIIKADTWSLILGGLLYALLPLVSHSPSLFIIFYVASSLLISVTMTSIYTMASEAVDVHENLFGTRQEGLLSAGVSLAIKVGMALGSAGVAWVLAWGDYQAEAVSESALEAISFTYYALPLIVFALQLACIRFYPQPNNPSNLEFK